MTNKCVTPECDQDATYNELCADCDYINNLRAAHPVLKMRERIRNLEQALSDSEQRYEDLHLWLRNSNALLEKANARVRELEDAALRSARMPT